jgi:DNA-binding MarR family transcriptional regulator
MKSQRHDLIGLLLAATKAIKGEIRSDGLNGITFVQLKTLRYIEEHNNPTMKDVALELGITPPSVTALIVPFILHGLVKRIYDKNDHRIVRLALTTKGKVHLTEQYNSMAEKMGKLLSNLNEEQIKNFKEILQILIKQAHGKQSN